jgi:DNA anti-recombination protein RmuC
VETEIITALIAAGSSLFCALIVGCFQNWRLKKKYEYKNKENLETIQADITTQLKLINKDIVQLTEEQKKYNNLQIKIADANLAITTLDTNQKSLFRTIDRIEKQIDEIFKELKNGRK